MQQQYATLKEKRAKVQTLACRYSLGFPIIANDPWIHDQQSSAAHNRKP